jgi:hypothetical protein
MVGGYMFKNIRAKLAAALAVGIVGVGAIATPAQAGTFASCAEKYLCFYDGTNYGTYSWTPYYLPTVGGNGCYNLTASFNNAVSSIVLNPGSTYATNGWAAKFYMNSGCTGTPVPWGPLAGGLQSDPDLSDGGFGVYGTNWSNAVTSFTVDW